MSRSRDISKILGATEVSNTGNDRLLSSGETVGLDSAEITSIAEGQGLKAYTALDSLPVTGLTAGDQAFIESDQRLYISNGSGWYNVALLNATPTLTLDQSGTIQMNADTLTVTVTASATDSDDNPAIITFSVESDGNMVGTGVTVSQDSSVFTITSLTADSGGVAGDFTLTFKATDNINVDTEALSFSLSFSTIVDSSAQTVLLMKATGNSATNAAITYQNSSDISTGFTEAGTPQASTFSPYRSGGYSAYFDGTGDYIQVPAGAFALSTGDFTIETWVYFNSITTGAVNDTVQYMVYDARSGATPTNHFMGITTSGDVRIRMDGIRTIELDETLEAGKWYHLALVNSSGTVKLYLNGTADATTFTTNDNLSIGSAVEIGGNTNDNNHYLDGYLRDFRVVIGTAVYTSNFTPPTEALTAVSGTSLLCCHLPYLGDGSTNDYTITVGGNTGTSPFGPYDYDPWVADDHGGSVYLDGDGDYLQLSDVGLNGYSGQFTIQGWVYPIAINTNSNPFYSQGNNASLSNFFDFGYHSDGRLQVFLNSGSRAFGGSAGDIKANQWNHFMISRNSTATNGCKMYANGKLVATGTLSGTLNTPSDGNGYIGSQTYALGNTTRSIEGYVADLKISLSNTEPFPGPGLTVPTSPIAQSGGALLMNNKSDANVYDAAAGNVFKLNGNTTSTTSQRKFTTSSAVTFDGTGDTAVATSSDIFAYGTGDFTWEAWIYVPAAKSNHYLLDHGSNGGSMNIANTKIRYYNSTIGTGSALYTTGATISYATWHHVAFVRSSGTTTIYVDGTAGASASDTHNYTAQTLTIGDYGGGSYGYAGTLQDLRITKGYARYTGNFTPPTAEFDL